MSPPPSRTPRSRRLFLPIAVVMLLGVLTSVGVAWLLATTAKFTEVADPHASAVMPVTFTLYGVHEGTPKSTHSRNDAQYIPGGLAESVTDESIRMAAAFFGGLERDKSDATFPYSQDRRFFSHRVFRSRAATREVIDRFHFDAFMSWEFFSVKQAMFAPPVTVGLFKRSFPSPAWPPAFGKEIVIVDEYGWLFAALTGALRVTSSDPRGSYVIDGRWAIALGEQNAAGALWAPDLHETARVLPLRPTLGMFPSAVFWASVWAVLLFVPGALRRTLRRRRGQCPHCGYDLRATPMGNPCPECGKAATSR